MASATKKESTNKLLRSLLLAEKNGFPIEKLSGIYREMVGEPLPFRAFGFNSLELYLRSIPEVVSLRRNGDGSYQCFGQADESTQHIKSLVSRQKSNKKRSRPKPMKFRSRPKPFKAVRGPSSYRAPPSRPAAFPRPTTRRGPSSNTGWGKPSGFNQSASNQGRPSSSSNYKGTPGPRVQESAQRNSFATSSKPQSKPQPKPQPQTQTFSNKTSNVSANRPVSGSGKWNSEPPSSGKWNSEPASSEKWSSIPPAKEKPPAKETRNTTAPSQSHKPATKVQSRQRNPSAPAPVAIEKPGQSAFVSVVSKTRSSSTSGGGSQKEPSAAPRVLAPRFLKQMQREMEEQRNKDIQKENQRKQQAQQLAIEHNNNQQELRITVSNEKVNENTVEDRENTPVREEWPKRKVEQYTAESGDWNSPVTERIIQSVPASNSTKTRSDSPVNRTYKEPARSASPLNHITPSKEEEPICKWFTKTLDNKNSGLWRSSLDVEYKKTFGKSLTSDMLQRMETLKILTIEKVFNQEIVYPNLKVEASNAARKVAVNGAGSRHTSSSSGTSSPIDQGMANLSIQQKTKTETSSPVPAPVYSPVSSPVPASPIPSSPSPTTMMTIKSPTPTPSGENNVPDYSHLAVPLPEDDIMEVYVSYIKNLQDFYVLIIDEEYSDKLFTLEEEMGHYYRYSRRKLQGPPAPGCMYAAELNKEWLRIMVDTVDGEHISCFLVDHGDMERVQSDKLQPLAPQFLHVPFQAIPCKLEGTEEEPENTEAVQKFCEVGLGQVLIAEMLSKEDAQVEVILYEEEAVATVNDLCLSCI